MIYQQAREWSDIARSDHTSCVKILHRFHVRDEQVVVGLVHCAWTEPCEQDRIHSHIAQHVRMMLGIFIHACSISSCTWWCCVWKHQTSVTSEAGTVRRHERRQQRQRQCLWRASNINTVMLCGVRWTLCVRELLSNTWTPNNKFGNIMHYVFDML